MSARALSLTAKDLEGQAYTVTFDDDTSIVEVQEIDGVGSAPIVVARGRWSGNHFAWEMNRLGPQRAATVTSILAPHLVVADESIGARTGWEQRCPACIRGGQHPPAVVATTFGAMLRGTTVRCANGHDVECRDPDGRVDELARLRGQYEHPHPPLEILPMEPVLDGGVVTGARAPRLAQMRQLLREYLERARDRLLDDVEYLTWLLLAEQTVPGCSLRRFDDGRAAFRYAPVWTRT